MVLAAVPGRLPEVATWAMLLIGFGAVGFALRKAKALSDARFEEKIRRLARPTKLNPLPLTIAA